MDEPAVSRQGWADWRSAGACQQEDPDIFFPMSKGPGLVQLQRAKAVCAGCPVRAECLEFAVRTVQDHGVWGGTSEDERRALRRARRRHERRSLASGVPVQRAEAGCGHERGPRYEISSGPARRRA